MFVECSCGRFKRCAICSRHVQWSLNLCEHGAQFSNWESALCSLNKFHVPLGTPSVGRRQLRKLTGTDHHGRKYGEHKEMQIVCKKICLCQDRFQFQQWCLPWNTRHTITEPLTAAKNFCRHLESIALGCLFQTWTLSWMSNWLSFHCLFVRTNLRIDSFYFLWFTDFFSFHFCISCMLFWNVHLTIPALTDSCYFLKSFHFHLLVFETFINLIISFWNVRLLFSKM